VLSIRSLVGCSLLCLLVSDVDARQGGKRRLVFYGVTASGGLSSWKVRQQLAVHKYDRLAGCNIPAQKRGTLPGSVRVTGVLTKEGRLRIARLKASGGHQPYEACMRRTVARWRLSTKPEHAGTTINFTFYVSFSSEVGILGALSTKGKGGVVGGLGLRGSGTGIGTGYSSRYKRNRMRYESQATVSSVTAAGALSQGIVAWALKQMRFESNVRYCHRTAAQRRPELKGRYELSLTVGKNGSLDRIELAKSTLDDAHLQSCVMRYLLRYSTYNPVTTFPTSKGTTSIKLTLDFPKADKKQSRY